MIEQFFNRVKNRVAPLYKNYNKGQQNKSSRILSISLGLFIISLILMAKFNEIGVVNILLSIMACMSLVSSIIGYLILRDYQKEYRDFTNNIINANNIYLNTCKLESKEIWDLISMGYRDAVVEIAKAKGLVNFIDLCTFAELGIRVDNYPLDKQVNKTENLEKFILETGINLQEKKPIKTLESYL